MLVIEHPATVWSSMVRMMPNGENFSLLMPEKRREGSDFSQMWGFLGEPGIEVHNKIAEAKGIIENLSLWNLELCSYTERFQRLCFHEQEI